MCWEKQSGDESALMSLRRLMSESVDEDGACHYLCDSERGRSGFFGDTVGLAQASLDAYETTAGRAFLEKRGS
jgi:hypothetical protein